MAPETFGKEIFEPLVHINESSDEIILMIDLPYARKEDIDLMVSEKTLEIKAVIRTKNERLVKFCFFHKILPLPPKIIHEKIKAKFEKGILLITLPKEKEVRRVKIE